MLSEPVLLAIISAIGGITVAYITQVLSKKYQEKKADGQPKDRMEQMFDGYERLIKQKDVEDERKARLMAELEEELMITRRMVKKLEHNLNVSHAELEASREENKELKALLFKMRKEYKYRKEQNLEEEQEEWYNTEDKQ